MKGNLLLDAPNWMRSDGLRAADWAVITDYINVLRPLKEATDSLQARGKTGGFGAVYEVLPDYYSRIITICREIANVPHGRVTHTGERLTL